jgi:hypothetical protein
MLAGVFIFGYGAARFVVEYFRNPDDHLADFAMRTGLSMGQWLTIPMLLLGLYLIVTSGRRDPIMAGDTDESEDASPANGRAAPLDRQNPVPLTEELRARIARDGPIGVADYIAAANQHYYASRDPLGEEGDFTTAPEISQMFGELVGLWLADLWLRAGRPAGVRYVELGPGRGTLADDALRAMRAASWRRRSSWWRPARCSAAQRACCRGALARCSGDAPEGALLVVATNFSTRCRCGMGEGDGGWRELVVAARGGLPPSGARSPAPALRPAQRRRHDREARRPADAPCALAQRLGGRAGGADRRLRP